MERTNVVDITKVSDEPELLVNYFKQHKVLETDNWLQGEVTGVDKVDNRNSHLTSFTLQYKDDDDIYTSRRIKDMANGDCFGQVAPWK